MSHPANDYQGNKEASQIGVEDVTTGNLYTNTIIFHDNCFMQTFCASYGLFIQSSNCYDCQGFWLMKLYLRYSRGAWEIVESVVCVDYELYICELYALEILVSLLFNKITTEFQLHSCQLRDYLFVIMIILKTLI